MKSKWAGWWLGLVILVSLSGLLYPIHFDEGVFWTMGQEMAASNAVKAVPYRDLWDHKVPGVHLVASFELRVASWVASFLRRQESMVGDMNLVGGNVQTSGFYQPWAPMFIGTTVTKIWVPRLVVMMMNWVSAGLIYLIGKKMWNKEVGWWSAVGWLLIIPAYEGQFWLTEVWMMPGVLGAMYLSFPRRRESMVGDVTQTLDLGSELWGKPAMDPLRVLRTIAGVRQVRLGLRRDDGHMHIEYFMIGVCLGVAMVFNQKAIVNAVIVLVYLAVNKITNYKLQITNEFQNQKNSQKFEIWNLWFACLPARQVWHLIFVIWCLAVGMVLVWLPVLLWLRFQGALADFWQAVAVYNLVDYRPMWGETIRNLWWLVLPGAGVWAGVGYLSSKLNPFDMLRTSVQSSKFWLLWLLVLAPLPLVLTRHYHHYWLQILPFAVLLVVGEFGGKLKIKNEKLKIWSLRLGLKYLFLANVVVVGLVTVGYGIIVSWPRQQAQARKAVSVQECGDFKDEPWLYYLTGCRPEERKFYREW